MITIDQCCTRPLSEQLAILEGLLSMRRAGLFFGVWCDNGMIRVKHTIHSELIILHWDDAQNLLASKGDNTIKKAKGNKPELPAEETSALVAE